MKLMRQKMKTFFFIALLSVMGMACASEGQIVGNFPVNFEMTPQCDERVKTVTFKNTTGEEIKINGWAITGGTNPADLDTKKANFSVMGTVIGGVFTEEVDALTIPAGVEYGLVLVYQPQKEGKHSTLVDIAYQAPKQGIVQLSVSASSEGVGDCEAAAEADIAEAVDFDGDLFFKIELMNSVVSGSPLSLSSVDADPFFTPICVPLGLDAANEGVTFPHITEADNFILPPSVKLKSNLPLPTQVVSRDVVEGTYDPNTGAITLIGIDIHLNSGTDFFADIVPFDLTTGTLDLPLSTLEGGDFLYKNDVQVDELINLVNGQAQGSGLKKNGRVTLVGVSRMIKFGGTRDNITSVLKANKGGIIIQISGKIFDTPEACQQ
jgi:hypothetical protein